MTEEDQEKEEDKNLTESSSKRWEYLTTVSYLIILISALIVYPFMSWDISQWLVILVIFSSTWAFGIDIYKEYKKITA